MKTAAQPMHRPLVDLVKFMCTHVGRRCTCEPAVAAADERREKQGRRKSAGENGKRMKFWSKDLKRRDDWSERDDCELDA